MAASQARELTERVAADPVAGLQSWAREHAAARPVDPLGLILWALADSGTPVSAMADQLGLGTRQLHRRCLALFGYGPRRLSRVLRLARALRHAQTGLPLGQAAHTCGYADQAHLSREARELAGTTPGVLVRESAGG